MMVRTRSSPAGPLQELHPNTINDENAPPRVSGKQRDVFKTLKRSPSTPDMNFHHILGMKQPQHITTRSTNESDISPVLQKLMQTPGRTYKTQKLLMQKHHEAKSNMEGRCVGGGISLWPEMDNMRLTATDIWLLLTNAITLLVLTMGFFYYLHGATLRHLDYFIRQLQQFSSLHPLDASDQTLFTESLLRWHREYSILLKQIEKAVEVSWDTCPPTYTLVLILYVSGILTLLFYLYENAFARSRLTPQRIKQWVSLIVILMTWTFLMLYFLLRAQNLENLVKGNVHSLNQYMDGLIFTELDLIKYENVLRYWTTHCLPPRSAGVLSLLGVISVQDLTYYLIYYSVPIFTALFTPIIQLIYSLFEVYRVNPHPD